MPAVRREVQHVARRCDLLFAFDKKSHAPLLDYRDLLVRMIVLRSDQKRLEAETANHHPVADKHLSLDSFGRMLNGNVGPVQMTSNVETVAVAIPVAVIFRRGVGHFCFLYFLSLTASRPDPLAAYSGCTFTTPYRRSSPSRIAAIIHRKLIWPPGAATFG